MAGEREEARGSEHVKSNWCCKNLVFNSECGRENSGMASQDSSAAVHPAIPRQLSLD